jgi:hypothetical protein
VPPGGLVQPLCVRRRRERQRAAARRTGAAALSEILLAAPSLFRRALSGVRGDLALAQSHWAWLQ